MNLDGFALPIKKLKGTDPVESLDLSGKDLGPASAVVIASLIGDNASITQVCHFRKVCLHALYVSITYPSVVCSWISRAIFLRTMAETCPASRLSQTRKALTPRCHTLMHAIIIWVMKGKQSFVKL